MTALGIDHLALPAYDALASRRFYEEVLGFRLAAAYEGEGWDGHDWLMMIYEVGESGQQVALCALAGLKRPKTLATDLPHAAFALADLNALAAMEARLQRKDVAVKREDHGGQQAIYLTDPNGHVLEFTAPPSASGAIDTEAGGTADRWIARHVGDDRGR